MRVWGGSLGTKVNADGTTSLVMLDGAASGAELLIGESNGNRTLIIINGQHKGIYHDSN